jgi:RimJ/RimL family protein N-acetyltransferase
MLPNLRPWKLTDLEPMVRFANNFNIAKKLTDKFPFPYTEKDGIAYLNMVMMDDPLRVFAIDIDGLAVGSIGVFPQEDIHRLNAEMGYWLAEPYWGKGIVTRAVLQMVEYAFRTFPVERIFARPFGSNVASQRVLEKAGFVQEGRFEKVLIKNGVMEDELFYAIRRIRKP